MDSKRPEFVKKNPNPDKMTCPVVVQEERSLLKKTYSQIVSILFFREKLFSCGQLFAGKGIGLEFSLSGPTSGERFGDRGRRWDGSADSFALNIQ